MPREIPLTKGYVAIVDDSDYDALIGYNWFAKIHPKTKRIYAVRNRLVSDVPGGRIKMHTQIMGSKHGFVVDHISRDSLDNRRSNFRWATCSQNSQNKTMPANEAGYKGVSPRPNGKFRARICINYRVKSLGNFDTPLAAAAAYDDAAQKMFGEFANTNFQTNSGTN
jgi:hypothetical protein